MAAATPTPALRPPPGVTSNFDHPESLAHQNIIAICIAIPLATIFFSLRTYTRIWIKKTWIFEDCQCTPGIETLVSSRELTLGCRARSYSMGKLGIFGRDFTSAVSLILEK